MIILLIAFLQIWKINSSKKNKSTSERVSLNFNALLLADVAQFQVKGIGKKETVVNYI
jgi:hypothetical protein